MEITYTDGTKVIMSANCDCGLTGGCLKCRPITLVYRISQNKLFMELVAQGLKAYKFY